MKKTLTLLLIFMSISQFAQITEIIEAEEEIKENTSIPFSVIEEVPIYPGCESLDNSGKKQCMNNRLRKLIAKRFDISIADCVETELVFNEETGKEEKQCISLPAGVKRIYLQFKIGKTGEVKDIKARAPHPVLKQEAIRIANLIPKMKPGKQRGEPVTVAYTLPITFRIE